MATISYWADDLKAARQWYAELLGVAPCFERPDAENPAFIEFRIGDCQDELGIIDAKYAPPGRRADPGGAVLYWHVDGIEAALARHKATRATKDEPLTPREAGFITASVVDPMRKILGIMHNPHFLEILGSTRNS